MSTETAYLTRTSPTDPALLPPRRPRNGLTLRGVLLARAGVIMITSVVCGAALFSFWVTFVAVSPLTFVAWLVLPVTAVVRRYANANRRSASRLLGTPIPPPYRAAPPETSWPRRVWLIVRDPASWRDACWLLVHAVAGCVLSTLQVGLFLGGVLYLIWPFLYWVTPPHVFGNPYGVFTLHSLAQSFWMEPFALVAFGLWWVSAIPLSRAEALLTRALLR